MKPMIVLAGGFGTRLKSVLNDVPKPLAPVIGKPFIIFLLEHWIDKGVNKFIFLLHYKSDLISKTILDFLSHCGKNITIEFIEESEPLGTGGSILNAIDELKINHSFLVVNADTWLGDGFNQISNMKPNTIAAVKVTNAQRYGSINIKNSLIKDFREKSKSVENGYISAGLYHLNPDIFKDVSLDTNFSLEDKIFPLLADKGKLRALKLKTSFIDIGIPEDYIKFCNWIEHNKKDF